MGSLKGTTGATAKKQVRLTKPALLSAGHNTDQFDCGEEVLSLWLRKRALAAIPAGTANTFVICRGKRVVGYFSLANGAVSHADASAKAKRNTPDPIPATVLARLAVDKTEQGHGLGAELLQAAIKRMLMATKHSAANMLVVHALNEKVAEYYKKHGFRPLKSGANALYIPFETLVAAL